MIYPRRLEWNFCPICGKAVTQDDDGQSIKPHCRDCHRFYYKNPVPAACCFVRKGDELLFVQRSVEPRKGLWTLPGGCTSYLDLTRQAMPIPFTTNAQGRWSLTLPVPNDPRFLGAMVPVQAVIGRTGTWPLDADFTNLLLLHVGR